MIGKALLSVIAVLLATSCAMASVPRKTHDGRDGTSCPAWPMHPAEELCSPSIFRLIARGEEYDERMLELTGYIVTEDDVVMLCPARGICEEGDWTAAIQLPSSANVTDFVRTQGVGKRVNVVGRYSASTIGRVGQVAGSLTDVSAIYHSNGP